MTCPDKRRRDKNIPTLLIYRNGQMTRQLIGLGQRGLKTTLKDIEGVLVAYVVVLYMNRCGHG